MCERQFCRTTEVDLPSSGTSLCVGIPVNAAMCSFFFPCYEITFRSTKLECLDLLNQLFPLRIAKTLARSLLAEFKAGDTSTFSRLNNNLCSNTWGNFPVCHLTRKNMFC